MRVIHLTSGLGAGGAETMLYRLVGALNGKDGQVHSVISLRDNCKFDFSRIGVRVDVLDLKGQKNPIRAYSKLRSMIREQDPDVIHAWMYHGNAASALAGPSGTPVVWGIHHSLHDMASEKLATRVLVKSSVLLSKWKKVEKIIYCSEKSQAHHEDIGYPRSKSALIPNGFDCNEYSPDLKSRALVRDSLALDHSHIVIGNFGRFHPVKDHELLLRAFAEVVGEFPLARVVLAGTDVVEGNAALYGLVQSLGIAEQVRLLGPRTGMPALYNAIDLYVLSSKSEAFPNVLGEASACGIPSISTDVGDAAIILGGIGAIVPPGDKMEMIGALRRMLAQDSGERRAAGALARAHIVSHFSLPVVAGAYAELYRNVITMVGTRR
jgi:glycosyltransferase involved in cell wall biosynthesis